MRWQEQTEIPSVQKRFKTVILPTFVDCRVQLDPVNCRLTTMIFYHTNGYCTAFRMQLSL